MIFAKEALQKGMVEDRLDYSSDDYWYQTGNEYDENKIDVFYSLSTTLISAKDKDGKQSYYSTLSDDDRQIMQGEYEYMSTEMFDSEHFNFIAPYYRQMTFETYAETDKQVVLPAMITAITDICDAFDYYMEHQNNGRPFILAGFSQGGVMTQVLLMHMTDQQYSQLIAAYSMGFQVAEKELGMAHIVPATGEDDLGVLVSFNSVASTDTMWNQIEGSAAACINPLNWKTDDTPATLNYNGDEATVHIDKEKQVLVVEGLDPDKYDGMGYPIAKGVYHMWDIRFYAKEINANAIHRAELKGNENTNTMLIREILYAHQDLKYADFIAKLVPTLPKESFIGVRTPEYKKILKELPEEDVIKDFMNDLPHRFYEENILHVTLIGKIKDFDDCLNRVERFLPYVDNWAVCDGLQPKIFKKHTEEIRKRIPGWITSEETYTRRFGLHMLMTYFLDDDFDEALLSLAADQRSEEYYANMMTAWAFAEALAKQWDAAVTYIEGKRLDKWTHNKAIQKAVESYKITDEQKTYLKSLKIK